MLTTPQGYFSDADELYRNNQRQRPAPNHAPNHAPSELDYATDAGDGASYGGYRQTFAAAPGAVFGGTATVDRRSRNQHEQTRLVSVGYALHCMSCPSHHGMSFTVGPALHSKACPSLYAMSFTAGQRMDGL